MRMRSRASARKASSALPWDTSIATKSWLAVTARIQRSYTVPSWVGIPIPMRCWNGLGWREFLREHRRSLGPRIALSQIEAVCIFALNLGAHDHDTYPTAGDP